MSLFPEYDITTQPAGAQQVVGLPVDFLRVDPQQDSALIAGLLQAAVEFGEMHTSRTFRLTSFTGRFPCLHVDCSMSIRRAFIEIDKSPFVDVQEFRVFEQGNDTATVLVPETARQPGLSRLFLPKTFTGVLDPDRLFPIEVDFRAGYATSAPTAPEQPVPPAIKLALQQHVAYLYENRGDVAGDYENAVPDEVIASYARVKIPLGAG